DHRWPQGGGIDEWPRLYLCRWRESGHGTEPAAVRRNRPPDQGTQRPRRGAAGPPRAPAYISAVGASLATALNPLPYDVIANEIKEAKASAELMGEGRVFGYINEVLQPTVDKAGALSNDP